MTTRRTLVGGLVGALALGCNAAPAEDSTRPSDTAESEAPVRYDDADGDGFGDPATATRDPGAPGVDNGHDCDDTDAAVHPDAEEACDGIDNDCDGLADGASATGAVPWFPDQDDDGFGDARTPVLACDAPAGFMATAGDCDDTDSSIFPGRHESCNGLDDDCDGEVDEGIPSGRSWWYPDKDGDGYGVRAGWAHACSPPSGYVDNSTDCDDTDSSIHPGAVESCNGLNDDCDSQSDEAGSTGELVWYEDADGDGHGAATSTTSACEAPAGHVAIGTDCDDSDADVFPGATERCDEADVDDDCDGLADDADPDLDVTREWYVDLDFDGFGDAASARPAGCAPAGYVGDAADCDDTDPVVHPGATESCDAATDLNCDGEVGTTDHDGDGAVACEDCDDTDPNEVPGATERADGDDDDCDGLIDEYPGDLVLTTRAEMDSFCASYAGVEGSLDLDGAPSLGALTCLRGVSGDLKVAAVRATDLTGLEQLTWVGGSAWFGGDLGGATWLAGSDFTSLNGLDRLTTVGGDLWVADNDVGDLSGAPRLSAVGGGVILYDLPLVDLVLPMASLGVGLWAENLPNLASVSAPALEEMGGGLWFERVATTSGSFTVDWSVDVPGTLGLVELPTGVNTSWELPDSVGALWISETELADLGGLEGLAEVSGDVVVSDNVSLADLSALDDLVSIGGDLTISDNRSLPEWHGFAALQTVGGRVRLSGAGPTDASGFGALTDIGDGLSVTRSASLTAISGFSALETGGDLELYSLAALTDATGLAGAAFGGDVSVTWLSAITDLAFLASTTDLAGSLVVTDNAALVTTNGLDRLETVGAAFTVTDNRALTDLSAPALREVTGAMSVRDLRALTSLELGALEWVGGDMALEFLDLLPDLSGLGALRSVGGLWVSQLDTLVDLDGLDALETVGGSLILEHNDALTTLTGLGSLTHVGTDLRLERNAALVDLAGLDALQTVGRDLTLDSNGALVRPDSLGALQSIGRDLWVESNPSLEDFSGVGSLSLGNTVWVSDCRALASLDGLEAIDSVPHHLVLYNLPALTDVQGLRGLRTVGTDFRISACDSLVDLVGLDNLESVGESFEIGYQVSWGYGSGNAALTSLDGLESLQTVGDTLAICQNPLLADIDALDGVESIGDDLIISDNVSLPTAEATELADGTPSLGGTAYISGNL